MEAHIVYPCWWAGAEIDGAEYVFLTKARKVRAQKKYVDALRPGSLFIG